MLRVALVDRNVESCLLCYDLAGIEAAKIRKGVVYIEYHGRVKPVHVTALRRCSYMLLSTLFEPWLDPGSITVNGRRYRWERTQNAAPLGI
jgi:hypothetical protein